ncbi:putative acetyltransferase [Anatilimnocola aggregata]|uniref:Putative acetyltransferase n=1 Tax=Anatilimnocola aggregata TaxID=2528021 RepID=A0A517YNK2_9BACT|nr:GNAT family N-acetyltransferase [Anatilimnocola aggregata]QDU31803.1 putative acetyltransferase [Anatilimnocola aggregata]
MSLEIRDFRPADLEPLRWIYLRSRAEAFVWLEPNSLLLQDFDVATQEEPILVAEQAGTIAGFVSWWPPENFIHNLFIDPAFTRQGIGRALLVECLTRIGRPATLKCVQQNANACAFYRALGWTIAAEGTGDHGAYFLMRKDAEK